MGLSGKALVEKNSKPSEQRRKLRSAKDDTGMVRVDEFELNQESALKKKFDACKRPDITYKPYGTGLILEFSSAMYEVFKVSVNDYYNETSESEPFSTVWRKDVDIKDQNHRDIVQVINLDGHKEYTVQLFHTTSKLQVNGNDYTLFITRDLPKLQKIAIHHITSTGKTTSDLNQQLTDVIHAALTHVNVPDGESQNQDSASKSDQGNIRVQNALPAAAIGEKDNHNNNNQGARRKTRKANIQSSNRIVCLERGCKYGRQDRENISMIQCGMCFMYYHYACTGDDQDILNQCVIFTCRDCRTMPSRVYSIMTDLETVKEDVSELPSAIQTIDQIKAKCTELNREIHRLKSLVEKFQNTLEKMQKQETSNPDKSESQEEEEYPPLPLNGQTKSARKSLFSDMVTQTGKEQDNEGRKKQARSGDKQDTNNDCSINPWDESELHTLNEWFPSEDELSGEWIHVSHRNRSRKNSKKSSAQKNYSNFNRQYERKGFSNNRRWTEAGSYHRKQGERRSFNNNHRRDAEIFKRRQGKRREFNYTHERRDAKIQHYSTHRDPSNYYYSHHQRDHYGYRKANKQNMSNRLKQGRNESHRFQHSTPKYHFYQGKSRRTWSPSNDLHRCCTNCGESNHQRDECWYDYPIKCRSCQSWGHKEKNCTDY